MGLLLFYALVLVSLRATSLAEEWHESTSRAKVAMVLVGAFFIVFSACYFGCYDFYPTWDSINYWQSALDFNKTTSTRASTPQSSRPSPACLTQ